MLIPVHRISLRILTRMYGSSAIHLDKASPLVPVLTALPGKGLRPLSDHIDIEGPAGIMRRIHPDCGHNLYRLHMHQLLDWMTIHVQQGQEAWPAMMDFYMVHDMTIDDIPPESVYRMWYRWENKKKSKNYLYKSSADVLKNISGRPGTLNDIFRTAAHLVDDHAESFYTRAGRPDTYMIRKAIMHSMYRHHHWSQSDIADAFDITQPAVSLHLRTISLS